MKKGKFVILVVSASLMHGMATVSVCNGAAPIIMPPSLPADSPFDYPDEDESLQDAAGAGKSDMHASDSTAENQTTIAPGISQGLSRSADDAMPAASPDQQAAQSVNPATPRSAGNSSNSSLPKVELPVSQPAEVSTATKPVERLPISSLSRHESAKPANTSNPKPKLESKSTPRSMTGSTIKTKARQDSAASANRSNVRKSVTSVPAREPEVQVAADPVLNTRVSSSPSPKHLSSQPVWPPPGEGAKVNILPTLPR